jgi:hypothetical protein
MKRKENHDVASVYELHLRCQALGQSVKRTRPSEARRMAAARVASEQRLTRLREILQEVRDYRRPWAQ